MSTLNWAGREGDQGPEDWAKTQVWTAALREVGTGSWTQNRIWAALVGVRERFRVCPGV